MAPYADESSPKPAMARTQRGTEAAAAGTERVRPAMARPITPSRRTLLKGAGAMLVTTALLATGEVVPVPPFRVAAADPPARPSGPGPAIATAADTLYQSYVGSDFQPEVTTKGEIAVFAGYPGGDGPIVPATTGAQNFSARLHLPQGATITEALFFVIHNDTAAMYVTIGEYSPAVATARIASTYVTTTSASIQTISVPIAASVATVDNTQYSYGIEWAPSTGSTAHELFGARVGYRLPGLAQLYGSAQAGIGVSGLSASGFGVLGQSDVASGIGVIGASSAGVGVKGATFTGFAIIGQALTATNTAAAVLGAGTAGPGVQGQSTTGHGLVGTTNDTGGHAGLIGNASAAGGIGLMGIAPGYGTASVGLAGDFFGNVKINGGTLMAPVMQTAIKHQGDGTYRALHTLTTPEGWVEDFGKGTLSADKADITLDHDFAALIQPDYHVFLTAHGPQHLCVSQQTASGFTVNAMAWAAAAGGPKPAVGGGTFSWRVVGKRRDVASERLAKVAAPSAPPRPATFTIPETPNATPPAKQP